MLTIGFVKVTRGYVDFLSCYERLYAYHMIEYSRHGFPEKVRKSSSSFSSNTALIHPDKEKQPQ